MHLRFRYAFGTSIALPLEGPRAPELRVEPHPTRSQHSVPRSGCALESNHSGPGPNLDSQLVDNGLRLCINRPTRQKQGCLCPRRLAISAYEPRQAVCNVGVPELFDVLVPDAVIAVADGLNPSITHHM